MFRAVLVISFFFFATVIVCAKYIQNHAQELVTKALARQFDADVSIRDLHLSVFPVLRGAGDSLAIRPRGQSGLPPLISVEQFTLSGSFWGLLRRPARLGKVELRDLEVHIPAGDVDKSGATRLSFVVDRITADHASVEELPAEPGKFPLRFELANLHLQSVNGARMAFDAVMRTTARKCAVSIQGFFGPWIGAAPGSSSVSGSYSLSDADLAAFGDGMRGTVSSSGTFRGQLMKVNLQGTADAPALALDFGNRTPVRATFAATIDAAAGETFVHSVEAVVGNSEFRLKGVIDNGEGSGGSEMSFRATSDNASLGDVLGLFTKGSPPGMGGTLSCESNIRVVAGSAPLVSRVTIGGSFHANGVRFTSPEVQAKIARLSHKAEGDPGEGDPDVQASMSGRFALKSGTVRLEGVEFVLPGAAVALGGSYRLSDAAIRMKGTARLQASLSRTTTGLKKVLLKPLDPLFRRDGAGAVLPIDVTGRCGEASFRLDIGRAVAHL